MTTKAEKKYFKFKFNKSDIILFGRESAGVPNEIHKRFKNKLKIPINSNTRSLNVALSAAIVASEALRQNNLYVLVKLIKSIIKVFNKLFPFSNFII